MASLRQLAGRRFTSVKEPPEAKVMNHKRILTLDGGGIKGVFAASFLAALEDQIQRPIRSYFDMLCGTSTGGIIALALGLGIPARKIRDLYRDWGQTVFKGDGTARRVQHFFRSKYQSFPLQRALQNVFGESVMADSTVRLVIPSYDLQNGSVYIYKTRHHPRFVMDYHEKMVTVALATSAAPTYFPPHRDPSGIALIDGGMWANNPVAVAVVEAIGVLGWDRSQIRILSVGCTQEAMNVSGGSPAWSGKFYWAGKVADLFLAGQSSGALGMAQWLIGEKNLHRVNQVVASNQFALDAAKEITNLEGLGAYNARHHAPVLLPTFFSIPADPFTPIK
jgi:hypothetical protein